MPRAEGTDRGERYSRQRLLPEIGEEGQRRLGGGRVAVVGCGALGTVQASLLVRAGVGETLLIDRDCVEPSNLQRQTLYEERDAFARAPKAVAAARRLRLANSAVRVVEVVKDLTSANAETILSGSTAILDGTDNYETRFLINDVAVKQSIPWVYGAAVGTHGSVLAIVPGRTACLRCLFPEPPQARQPTCDTAGVLNAATSLIASLQAAEALKILVGRLDSLDPRLRSWNLWTGERSALRADGPDPACPACGRARFDYLEASPPGPIRICGRDAVQVGASDRPVDLPALARQLAHLGSVRESRYVLRFACPPHELTVFPDGRAIIKGTQDPALARSLYARYVGV